MCSYEKYKNFVRANEESPTPSKNTSLLPRRFLSGADARRFYIDVYSQQATAPATVPSITKSINKKKKCTEKLIESDHQLFVAAQNNEHEILKMHLVANPDKINVLDEYGWSLLMVACHANSVQTVITLLDLGINRSIRDRAGNSANSLVIKQKNIQLIDILLDKRHKRECEPREKEKNELYECPECQKKYENKMEHLLSTIHNINVSKGKKILPWYAIPESNRGYQILVRSGWNREDGLGPDGTGKKYPIKPVMKQDRKGLGAVKRKALDSGVTSSPQRTKPENTKKRLQHEYHCDKTVEKNFRREFY